MQPNILFITADQWRGECLSHAGHPLVKTPSLDALAAEGVSFQRHYANCVPCAPSRASIHTGMYLQNHRSGTNQTPLDRRHSNWALELRKAGYDPVLFGYTDTVPDPRQFEPGDPALSNWEGVLPGLRPVLEMNTEPGAWYEDCKAKGYKVPDIRPLLYALREPGPDWEDGADAPKPLAIRKEDNDTSYLFNTTMDFIADQTSPWAVHLSIMRPHPPWVASKPYNALYNPNDVPPMVRKQTPEEEAEQHPWLAHQLSRKTYRAPANEKAQTRYRAVYYGLMTEVDDHMGRLIAFLKERGLYDNTLIIFVSDHGEQMGDHWLRGKCGYFDASYHVPLIIRDPRKEADAARGTQIHSFTENVDLMPTLLAHAGLEIPVQCDGHALTHFLEQGTAPSHWRTEAHWEFDFRDPADDHAEQMIAPYFPVPIDIMQAQFSYKDFDTGEAFDLSDRIHVRTALLNHPGDATAYRLEFEGKSLCYVTDTEHVPGKPDQNVLGLIEGADMVIYDCSYEDEEFAAKVGWGHSTWQEGIRLCRAAGVKQLAIFHHDPDHEDDKMEEIECKAKEMWEHAFVARENVRLIL
ncbi:sulfatase-like hydrolase/transferase [bacterium AH-315-P15]|nr:sulfatase-like hydrolase/transferase [bacterium AH-315-P15]